MDKRSEQTNESKAVERSQQSVQTSGAGGNVPTPPVTTGPKKRCRALSALIRCIRAIRFTGRPNGKVGPENINPPACPNTNSPQVQDQMQTVDGDRAKPLVYYPHIWLGAQSLDEVLHKYGAKMSSEDLKEKLGLPSGMQLCNVLDSASLPIAIRNGKTVAKRIPVFEIPEAWLPPLQTPLVPEDCSALDIDQKPVIALGKRRKKSQASKSEYSSLSSSPQADLHIRAGSAKDGRKLRLNRSGKTTAAFTDIPPEHETPSEDGQSTTSSYVSVEEFADEMLSERNRDSDDSDSNGSMMSVSNSSDYESAYSQPSMSTSDSSAGEQAKIPKIGKQRVSRRIAERRLLHSKPPCNIRMSRKIYRSFGPAKSKAFVHQGERFTGDTRLTKKRKRESGKAPKKPPTEPVHTKNKKTIRNVNNSSSTGDQRYPMLKDLMVCLSRSDEMIAELRTTNH